MHNLDIASDYLNACFADLPRVIERAVTKLAPHLERFEGIAVRGTSGLLVGPMVAATLKKPWCIIRKPGDGTHSDYKAVEGWFGFRTYIIIDDLISTGGTLKAIQQLLRDYARSRGHAVTPRCMGYYLYNWDELKWRGENIRNESYCEKYFLYPEDFKRPTVSKQIAAAAATRPANFDFPF